MSTDAPFKLPRKKPNAMWLLGGVFLLLLLVFIFQLFGPSPPITVSPATTHITTPLGPNGLPDYEKYVLDKSREGVTSKNNAAALLWPALWPGELGPQDYAAISAELGLSGVPSTGDALTQLYDKRNQARIAAWLRTQNAAPASGSAPNPGTPATNAKPADAQNTAPANEDDDAAAEQLIASAMESPWTSAQIPPLAKWIAENQQPLDQMLAASHRSRCYFPSPSMLNGRHDGLFCMLLPGQQSVREAGRALTTRAMWHVGEGRPAEAWQDLLAAHRIGHLTTQGQTLVEQLIGIAISGMACNGTVTMLHHGKPTADQARQVMHDLATLKDFSSMADSIDQMERAGFLDAIIRFKSGNLDELGLSGSENLSYVRAVSIDWNVVLRKGNVFYDRLVAAARLPNHSAREQALNQIENEVSQMANGLGADSLVAAALSPAARSDEVASMMLGLFLPSVRATVTAQNRANTTQELTRLAAALAVYRAEHTTYPAKLDDLVPGVLKELPVDLFNAKPFVYKRTDDGYLLYSAGDNGQDEGGSNEQLHTFEGRPLDDDDAANSTQPQPNIPTGSDDLSIRVPRPLFKLPVPKPSE